MSARPWTVVAGCLAVGLLLGLGRVAWRLAQRPARGPAISDRDVAEEMRSRARRAVIDAATEFGVTLDFTPESVEAVEEILAKLHARHEAAPLPAIELNRESLKWGAYVGEVIRRMHRARWALDSRVNGEGSLPLVFEDKGESYPVGWCYRRLTNGEEDNVWAKFLMYARGRDAPALKGAGSEEIVVVPRTP